MNLSHIALLCPEMSTGLTSYIDRFGVLLLLLLLLLLLFKTNNPHTQITHKNIQTSELQVSAADRHLQGATPN